MGDVGQNINFIIDENYFERCGLVEGQMDSWTTNLYTPW